VLPIVPNVVKMIRFFNSISGIICIFEKFPK
jgi:hypothetical protein